MHRLSLSPKEISSLPDKPGVYQFFSKDGKVIYVGKAKDLKKRVANYFQKNTDKGRKTAKLVQEIDTIGITIVNSEFDAFLLENTLIKENQPKYNILLKDDKTFPYICITNERFPRIISTRKVIPNAGTYFGPYASVPAMKNMLELIRNIYHVRTCTYNLSQQNIEQKKFKVCLEYHIEKCLGPCEGLHEEISYNEEIRQINNILKGDIRPAKDYFLTKMTEHAGNMEFEKAEIFKQRFQLLEKFQSKTLVVNPNINHIDVFTIVSDTDMCYINYLKIHNGAINHTFNIEVKKKLNESDEEILLLWIVELKNKFHSNSMEIISNIELNADLGCTLSVPKIGDKRKLIELSLKNALYFKKEKTISRAPVFKENKALIKLQSDLKLKTLPKYIECFDNSNLQGHSPVASMVCFINGKPSKSNYRKFNIKTVVGADDFASMKEIIGRRYQRLIDEKKSLPDLIVIDGGKGQLSSAIEALHELKIYGTIPIVGIAKRLEEIYFPGDEIPLHLDKKSLSLQLLQNLRNEAHRFAITFHRQKRDKKTLSSEMDLIKGIGPKSKQELLRHFKSLDNIKKAGKTELEEIVGLKKASILMDFINKKG